MNDLRDSRVFQAFEISEDFEPKYEGHGQFGHVYSVKSGSKIFALKKTRKRLFDEKAWETSQIVRKEKCPFLLEYLSCERFDDYVYMKLEYANAGNITHFISENPDLFGMNEFTKRIMWQIVSGLRILHENKIPHSDLNTDKILLHTVGKDVLVKISDYGFVWKDIAETWVREISNVHKAPEIWKSDIPTTEGDMWSLGVVFYMLITKEFPYPHSLKTYNDFSAGRTTPIQRSPQFFPGPSADEWWELVQGTLRIDPSERLSVWQVMRLPLFKNFTSIPPPPLPPPLSAFSSSSALSPDRGRQIVNNYLLEKVIGGGACGEVWLASKEGKKYAVKKILCLKPEILRSAEMEEAIAGTLSVENQYLVRYFEILRHPPYVYMVMKHCSKGDLEKMVENVDYSHYTPSRNWLMKVAVQLLTAVRTLHSRNILHRDIKAANVLVDADDNVQLGDYGVGKILEENKQARTYIGSPAYMAPEVLKGSLYSFSADVWSLGVLFYYLCAGRLPFTAQNEYALQTSPRDAYAPLTEEQCAPEMRDIIAAMLTVDHTKRPTPDALLQHPYVQKFVKSLGL